MCVCVCVCVCVRERGATLQREREREHLLLASKDVVRLPRVRPCQRESLSSYTEVYSVVYDSGSVPRRTIFSPGENNPESIMNYKTSMTTYLDSLRGFGGD